VALAVCGRWTNESGYLDYCDLFYFAIPPDFPRSMCPSNRASVAVR